MTTVEQRASRFRSPDPTGGAVRQADGLGCGPRVGRTRKLARDGSGAVGIAEHVFAQTAVASAD